jgi:hypothetical protein
MGPARGPLQAWPRGHRFKRVAPYKFRTIKGVAKNQKSEGGGGNAGYRRKLLIVTDMTLDPNTSSAVRSV